LFNSLRLKWLTTENGLREDGARREIRHAYGLRRDGFRKNHKVGGQLSFVYMERSVLLLSQTVCKKVDVPFFTVC
jgi:hypothetical protein